MARWLIFLGLGPLIGFATFFVAAAFVTGALLPIPLAALLLVGIPYAYVIGLLPALVAAHAVKLIQSLQAPYEGLWVSLAGAVTGLVLIAAWALLIGENPLSLPIDVVLIYAVTTLVPTLICWRLDKRLVKAGGASAL